MTATLIPAMGLLATAIIGIVGLRRFPSRVRMSFDAICFLAISLYFLWQRTFPLFPPLSSPTESGALWLRAVGGAWWLFGSRIVVVGLGSIVQRYRRSREARLFSDLSAAGIYIATAAVVLNSVFALPITGIVATSGIVAIVLGLALQNTLADVFSGIAVGIEAPFKVGDRVQIAERIEGQVVQVNWRSIRIQTDGDDVAIIPNSLIAKAEIINRSFPTQRRQVSVELTCRKGAAPDRVIETLLEATLLCSGILRIPAPSAILAQLGSKRNTYTIGFHVDSTKHLSSTKDQLLRGADRQLRHAGFLGKVRDREARSSKEAREAALALRLLRDLILFESLDDDQVDGLACRLDPRRLEPGEELFAQGASDESLYVIASGILEFTRNAGSVAETIGCMGAGDYVGEIGLFTGAPHAATATARVHSDIYRLPRAAVAPLLTQNSDLAAAFDRSVRRGLAILHRDIAVRVAPSVGAKGQLLRRIQSIFRVSP